MKVLFINAVCGLGSTGRICTDLAGKLAQQGCEVKIAYGRKAVPQQYESYAVRIGNKADVCWHALMTRLFDGRGFWSRIATRKFLKWAEEYDPDLLWLHNLHDHFINIDMLFRWIKSRPEMEVRWTQHDCWAFTGHCFHFTAAGCEQWKTHCLHCGKKAPFRKASLLDRCERNYNRKQNAFCGIKKMTLISPSRWLADLLQQSFLKEYPVKVVPNTVDTNVFKPTPGDFRERYGLEHKKIVLGVANIWEEQKGLNDFMQLSQLLDDSYVTVLVGLTKKQIQLLPERILGMGRTCDVTELCRIYTAADVFVNPTYEDNYPTVNLEARACGTAVITYRTGGSPESAGEKAFVVKTGDITALGDAIVRVCQNK